jgi:hypothetical protein
MEVHPMLEEGGTAGASNPRADASTMPPPSRSVNEMEFQMNVLRE